MKGLRFLVLLAIMSAVVVSGVSAVPQQGPDGETCKYFPETQRHVCGEFLTFFNTRGKLAVFGYPLTQAYDEPALGLRVQYFQRARMELHPYQQEPYTVQLGLLTDELLAETGRDFPPASPDKVPPFNSALHHYFPETGHVISYAFLDLFRECGGLDTFGYPRSEALYENGYIVQYFQRGQMEWHPETVSGPKTRLTNVGEIYLEQFDISGGIGSARFSPGIIDADVLSELRVSASVDHIVIGGDEVQTVFVYVSDHQGRPVAGATVGVAVRYPAETQPIQAAATNSSGLMQVSFPVLPSPPGQKAVVVAEAMHDGRVGETQAFFLSWW